VRFGERLRRRRKDQGLSQDEVAALIGVSQPTVGKWENGRAMPEPQYHERLAVFLDANTADIVHWIYGSEDELVTRLDRVENRLSKLEASVDRLVDREAPSAN
jgi:transcriptional regulator with XRE-family HTH domain